MKKHAVIAFGLVLGFSANSVFAETKPVNYNPVSNGLADRIAQVQLQAMEAKSRFLDEINVPEIPFKKVKVSRTLPKSNNKNRRGKRDPKPPVTGRKKTAKEKMDLLKNSAKWKPSTDPDTNISKIRGHKKQIKHSEKKLSKREARIYRVMMNSQNLDQLSSEQRKQLIALHKRVLKTREAQILLRTIQIGEDGGLLVIVGKGEGKSGKFKQYMNRLTTETHPANQFPKGMRCFVRNKQLNRCSTAAGFYQITKTNFDLYKKHLGIKDFSKESQDLIALELIRTGQAVKEKGNYKGRGYVELLKGNIKNAIRYGTNDWASSKHSQWKPHNQDYVKISRNVAKNIDQPKFEKIKDQEYFQGWLNEFAREGGSNTNG